MSDQNFYFKTLNFLLDWEMTLLFYPNFFRGKLSPNKIGLFLIRRHSLNIKIGEEIGDDRIVRRGPNWGQGFLL